MKKLMVIGLAAMMVMGLACAASANWIVNLHAENAAHGAFSADSTFGMMTAGTGYTSPGTPAAANCLAALSWTKNASDAYLIKDYRLTGLPNPLEYQVFVINGGSYTDSKIYLKMWSPSATFQAPGTWYLVSADRKTTYWSGAMPVASNATAAAVAFAFDATTTGTQLYLTTVNPNVVPETPEPGSIVAMLSGLVGLGGYAIRRRK